MQTQRPPREGRYLSGSGRYLKDLDRRLGSEASSGRGHGAGLPEEDARAVIPYCELREIPIGGGRSIAVFGTLVALGILAGAWFAERRARLTGTPEAEIMSAILSAVVPGLIVAHLVAVLPPMGGTIAWSPRLLLQFWNGMSSFGGVAGAFVGLSVYYRRTGRSWLPTADALAQGLVVGWVFGRLGCTLVHDHVGTRSESLLAVRFPDGPRHDLGLYELLYTVLVLVPAVIVLNRRRRAPGVSVAVLALLYAPARFLADFLRQTDLPGADVRYLGFTVGQYGSLVLAAVGVALAIRIRDRAPT
jgi:phosphatidylglycerol:prolipoprotein diacylglycerol transferase